MNFTELDLSIICNFYFDQKNADSLYSMLNHYAGYNPELMRKIQFVLVDDHSKIDISIPKDLPLNFQHLRIKNDIQWNNGGARNLGVVKARTAKILLNDIDIIFPESLLEKIVKHKPSKNKFYKFKRVADDGSKRTSPTNTLYMTKSVFFDALGYDEEFAGYYGFEDSFLRELLKSGGYSLRYFTRWTKVVDRKVDRENSYHEIKRDTKVSYDLYLKKQQLMKQGAGRLVAHSRLFLNFEWECIEERMYG